jgi:pimeloyl-ACP methyl ester carboxylesterase
MARTEINGIQIHYEIAGDGDPLVLVHGSWTDHTVWQTVAGKLSARYRVISYDRRGHSRTERPDSPRNRQMDEDDLAAIIETLAGEPAHVAGSSFGALTTLGLLARRPELLRGVCLHEPPPFAHAGGGETGELAAAASGGFGEVVEQIAAGDVAGGTRRFIEEYAMGPGAWDMLPESIRAIFLNNAPAFVAEQKDTRWSELDLDGIAASGREILLTRGTVSPRYMQLLNDRLVELLPNADGAVVEGAGHSPHITHPDVYADLIESFVSERAEVAAGSR